MVAGAACRMWVVVSADLKEWWFDNGIRQFGNVGSSERF